MVRVPLTEAERRRGRRLGALLRAARAHRSMGMGEVAAAAGVSTETLRKIETGRIVTPALFTVAALAEVLELSLDAVVAATTDATDATPDVTTDATIDEPIATAGNAPKGGARMLA